MIRDARSSRIYFKTFRCSEAATDFFPRKDANRRRPKQKAKKAAVRALSS
jgi:hypothetical protein